LLVSQFNLEYHILPADHTSSVPGFKVRRAKYEYSKKDGINCLVGGRRIYAKEASNSVI
jgi:hypothetical protein